MMQRRTRLLHHFTDLGLICTTES